MARITQTIYSEGIFSGLPTFPSHDGKKYTAIVTGSNGISGSEIVKVLAAAPERWETIYSMSRRPPQSSNPRVKPIAADFLSSTPEELAALFKREGIKADYIFFTSYMQPPLQEGAGIWADTSALEAINVTLLQNFLSALALATIIPTRFLLQTGGKHYGLHLGPTTVPMTEDTPQERIPHANFYFPQEDLLATWCRTHSTHYNITRPAFIIGASPTAQINISYALALYASIQRELGLPLEFPADVTAWDASKDLTTAGLIGYFSEWAVLTPDAADEALNIIDDSPFAWGKFWVKISEWYGISHGIPKGEYAEVVMGRDPPPRGFGGPGKVFVGFSFEEWAGREEVRGAWGRLVKREGLDGAGDLWGEEGRWRDVFATLDAELLGGWGRVQTMDKSKKLGWHGHVQTDEGIRDTFEKMVELKMIPRL